MQYSCNKLNLALFIVAFICIKVSDTLINPKIID